LLPEVFKRDLAGIEGKELLALLLEFKPDAANRKHYHLGEGVAYVLEGSGIYEQEGKPPVEFKSGDVRYKPANEVHRVKNASSTAPLKILVILIQGKGDPRAIPVK
jgi:quercetin dioxygenase-like cupin family protein